MLIHKKKPPQKGDLRIKEIFALWPKPINPDTDAWLQFVFKIEMFTHLGWSFVKYYATLKEANSHILKDITDRLEKPNITPKHIRRY